MTNLGKSLKISLNSKLKIINISNQSLTIKIVFFSMKILFVGKCNTEKKSQLDSKPLKLIK